MRVLIAEDDDRLARAVAAGLRRRGMTADVAVNGGDALGKLAASRYDVVVLDRDLPGVHGDEICRRLAAEGSASRILMLTAARSVRDRVEGRRRLRVLHVLASLKLGPDLRRIWAKAVFPGAYAVRAAGGQCPVPGTPCRRSGFGAAMPALS